MPWTVSVDRSLGVITTVYSGTLSRAELGEAVGATVAACAEHQFSLLLADCSRLEGGHSVLDLYDTAVAVVGSAHGVPLREAVLVPASARAAESVAFWETTATNRGLQVSLFDDVDSAMAWLTNAPR